MTSDIGIGGQMFIDGRDITLLLSAFTHTSAQGNVDNTRLRSPGRFRTHAVTLNGGSIGFTGDLPDDDATALTHLNQFIGHNYTPHIIMQAPYGADTGKLVRFGKAIRNNTEMGAEVEGILSLNAEFEKTAGSPGVMAGLCLFSPNLTSGTLTQNEIADLVFTSADPNQFFGLRAVGTTETFAFQTTISNSALKVGIEALAAYTGRTVTVTGSSLTGSTLKSGSKRIEFDGAVNVPALEVISGLVESFVVANGDADADYRWNNSTPHALGFDETTAQSDQQALSGRSAAIVKGSSQGGSPNVATGGTPTGTPNNAGGSANAFDGDTVTVFTTNEGPGFLQYQFAASKTPKYVTVIIYDNGSGNCIPPRLTFYGTNSSAGTSYNTEPTSGTLLGNFAGMADNLSAWTSIGNDRYSKTFALTNNAAFGYMQMWYTIPSAGSVFITEVKVYESDPAGGGYLASFKAYYPLSVTGLASPTSAGTGANASRTVSNGDLASAVGYALIQQGGTFTGTNIVSSATSGPTVRDIPASATSNKGMLVSLQNLLATVGTSTWKIQHAPDNAGSAGTFVDLLTFDTVSAVTGMVAEVPVGTTIYPYLRARCSSITGSAQVAVAAARRF